MLEQCLVQAGPLVVPRVRGATQAAPLVNEIIASYRRMSGAMAFEINGPQALQGPPRTPPGEGGVTQVGRQPYAALWASYAVRLEEYPSTAAAHTWALALETVTCDKGDGRAERERSRTAERLVRNGDAMWAELGAWPWACDDRAVDKKLPIDAWRWWEDESVVDVFIRWRDRARGPLAADLAQRRFLHDLSGQRLDIEAAALSAHRGCERDSHPRCAD